MTPEEIRKQMMGSAGMDVEQCIDSPAANTTRGAERIELSEEKPASNTAKESSALVSPSTKDTKPTRAKSMLLALVLAFFFGPFGLFYVSWKRALVMLLLFIVGVSLIPKNGFVVLLLWLVAPILSIIALGVGKRQTPPA